MPVVRELWTKYWFTKSATPSWQCPVCNLGVLHVIKGSIHDGSDMLTKRNTSHPNWEPLMWTGTFSCLLECNNANCGQTVAASGNAEAGEGDQGEVVSSYKPTMITPPLLLLPIPKECPDDIAEELRQAFKLFWCDLAGGMNHFRKAVELIMDRLQVPKRQKTRAGKYVRVDLHGRINRFRAKNQVLADRLEAVKWLGNVGSHSSDVTADDYFDACDLLEDFISAHFKKQGDKIVAMTKRIIKSKGKR